MTTWILTKAIHKENLSQNKQKQNTVAAAYFKTGGI